MNLVLKNVAVISDADMPSPEILRSTMNPLLRHTRLCTVPHLDIANEVAPSNILNERELFEIFMSVGAKVESSKLSEICSNMKQREVKTNRNCFVKVYGTDCSKVIGNFNSTKFEILVKERNVEIVSAEVSSNKAAWALPLPNGLTYQCDGKITIEKVNYSNNASYDLLHEIPFNETVEYESDVELKLKTSSGANLVLEANNKYKITVEFTLPHRAFEHKTSNADWDKNHFDLSDFTEHPYNYNYGHHFQSMLYRLRN